MTAAAPASVTQSALPVLVAVEALAGFAASGATNRDLAESMKVSPPTVTRCMATLIHQGWARKDESSGRFYPTTHFARIVFRISADMDRAESRLQDLRRSMTGN